MFVVGLARAGTTILMRLLHDSGAFATLSYRDMPFPLAPNTWARATARSRRDVVRAERGHGDGIDHDLDSPEAIEEVFWRMREGKRYIRADTLVAIPPVPETIAAFRDYVRLVLLRHGRTRYLSKNNNNILRLAALVDAEPTALIVHPFRDPLQQAASLRAQHRRAEALAFDDPFRSRYMRWLGHHEFGVDHRPFVIGSVATREIAANPGSIDYWLARWIDVNTHLLAQPATIAARQVFVDYDALCEHGDPALDSLRARTALALRSTDIRAPSPRRAEYRDQALLSEARTLHDRLRQRARSTG